MLCATPSYALAIAEVAEQQGVDLRKSALEIGLFGAEPWSEAMRREIEARLGLKAVDIYGLSEIMGPGVACECEMRRPACTAGRTTSCSRSSIPRPGKPVPEGEAGRARDHDADQGSAADAALPHARHHADHRRAPCDCGRTHLRILRITGRNDDMLIIRGVNVYPSQIEAVLVGRPDIAPHYQLVVERQRQPRPCDRRSRGAARRRRTRRFAAHRARCRAITSSR